jgi:hypothetical protein
MFKVKLKKIVKRFFTKSFYGELRGVGNGSHVHRTGAGLLTLGTFLVTFYELVRSLSLRQGFPSTLSAGRGLADFRASTE